MAKKLWQHVEDAAAGRDAEDGDAEDAWFLATGFSALDIYIAVMGRWRPGRAWFRDNTPRLSAIADRAPRIAALAPVFRDNFPNENFA